jgi:hypothetical protein
MTNDDYAAWAELLAEKYGLPAPEDTQDDVEEGE